MSDLTIRCMAQQQPDGTFTMILQVSGFTSEDRLRQFAEFVRDIMRQRAAEIGMVIKPKVVETEGKTLQ